MRALVEIKNAHNAFWLFQFRKCLSNMARRRHEKALCGNVHFHMEKQYFSGVCHALQEYRTKAVEIAFQIWNCNEVCFAFPTFRPSRPSRFSMASSTPQPPRSLRLPGALAHACGLVLSISDIAILAPFSRAPVGPFRLPIRLPFRPPFGSPFGPPRIQHRQYWRAEAELHS